MNAIGLPWVRPERPQEPYVLRLETFVYRVIKRWYEPRTSYSWREVLRRDLCCYCGDRGGTVEHITPRSLGGHDKVGNMVGACRRCNRARGSRPLLHFLLHRIGLERRIAAEGVTRAA